MHQGLTPIYILCVDLDSVVTQTTQICHAPVANPHTSNKHANPLATLSVSRQRAPCVPNGCDWSLAAEHIDHRGLKTTNLHLEYWSHQTNFLLETLTACLYEKSVHRAARTITLAYSSVEQPIL